MINELIFVGSTPNVSISRYLLMGSSDYTERNFPVSCLWNKSLDASILGGNHWNGSDSILNLYLIPLVKQSALFYSPLFLVSRDLKSLCFNLLEDRTLVIYLSSHQAPEEGKRSVYLTSALKNCQQILPTKALSDYTLVSRDIISNLF